MSDKTNNQNEKLKDNVVVRLIRGVDRPMLITIIMLLCIGSVMVLSASYVYASEYKNNSYYYAERQLVFVIIGLIIMFIVSKIPYDFIRKFSKAVLAVSIILLVAVIFLGTSGGGAQRWIYIGPISIQPSEIAKFAVVLFFADYASKNASKISLKGEKGSIYKIALPFLALTFLGIVLAACPFLLPKFMGAEEGAVPETFTEQLAAFFESNALLFIILGVLLLGGGIFFAYTVNIEKRAPDFYYGVLPYILVVGVIGGLLVAQPHLSGLIIIGLITLVMMIAGGTSLQYVGSFLGAGALGVLALVNLLPHAKTRLAVWENPFEFLTGDGWQPAQSLYAIGSGGLWGVGLGNSRQKHLYLPEPHNDYIFAVLCEELGFIGAFFVICLFIFFVYRGIVIAMRAPDRFSSLLVLGIIAHVGLQALLNMLVVTNTLPSTGISLPFFSYGGSSLIILLAEMGVVLGVSKYSIVEKN